jgi:hypothetical protein
MAITEQQKEEFFRGTGDGVHFKLGYCISVIRHSLWLLDTGKLERAREHLRETVQLMEDTKNV